MLEAHLLGVGRVSHVDALADIGHDVRECEHIVK